MKYPETARRLSYILNLRDMTAQELSNRSGVGKSSISHYINGNNEPHSHNAGKMAKVLNVDPQWLMGFDVSMEKKTVYGLDFGNSFSATIPGNLFAYISLLNSDGLKKAEEYLADLSDMEKYKK